MVGPGLQQSMGAHWGTITRLQQLPRSPTPPPPRPSHRPTPPGVSSNANGEGRQAGGQPDARRAAAPAQAAPLPAGRHSGGQGECCTLSRSCCAGAVATFVIGGWQLSCKSCVVDDCSSHPFILWLGGLQVRHPGVGVLMERDFTLMRRAAQVLAALPVVGTPQVKESVMQVGRSARVLPALRM